MLHARQILGGKMNKLIEISSMMRVEKEKIMGLLSHMFESFAKTLKGLFDFKNRRIVNSLKIKLDNLEKNPRIIQKLVCEVTDVLKVYSSKSLERKWIGYKYRMGLSKKDYPESRILKALISEAEIWKKEQEHVKSARLTPREIEKVHEIAEYTEFAKFILNTTNLKRALFSWTLLDGNDAAAFIEFPATADRLIKSNLSLRIGRMGGKDLRIRQGKYKYLTLPFEGVEHSIMNDASIIELSHSLSLTIGDVFKIFENKAYEGGILEYMKEGIINYSPLELGSTINGKVEPVSVKAKKWWEKLPLLETLSKSEVISRYGIVPHSGEWIASAASTRGSLNLDFNKTHAFIEIAIPQKNGDYRIFDFGKFAMRFPKTIFEMMKMFCQNVQATIAYPDENVFYSFREKAFHPFLISEYEGEMLMNEIKQDIEKAREGNMIYQIESENCAKWVHNKLSAVIGHYSMPHLFYMPLLETEPSGLAKLTFKLIKSLPATIQVRVLSLLHLPLGAFQETVIEEEGELVAKSLKDHDFFEHGHVYLPALLNQKRMELEDAIALAMERAAWNIRKAAQYYEVKWDLALTHLVLSFSFWSPPRKISTS